MNAIKQLTHPGDSYTLDAGRKLVHVTWTTGTGPMAVYHVEITTNSPVARPVGDDDRSFNRQDIADHYAQMAAELARVEVEGVDTDALAANILADEAERETARAQVNAAAQADVDTIMATTNGFRGHRRPTRTGGVNHAELSDVQRRALASHTDGVIGTGPGVGGSTLKALAGKGYGRLRFEGTRYRIVALVLNARGLAEAGQAVTR